MAVEVEVVRHTLCDICLKRDKTKTEKDVKPQFAVVLLDGGPLAIDLCAEHSESLTYAQIIAFGYGIDMPVRGAKRAPSPPDDSRLPGGSKEPLRCSACGKVVSKGSGWFNHNKSHLDRGQTGAVGIPVGA